ncbi:hypothetical protein [Neorhizobium sp. DAR64860/K0K1]|uniref:hypothetical protein n=1 Tax=Neorhizobium sp. DAR64860/K0K1 TaxID=3421955 RepID=UPI003D2884C8
MPTFSTAGSKIFIGTAMSDDDGEVIAADFTAVTWTEIGRTTTLGTFGDTSNSIDSTYIDRARVQKRKGARNAGTIELAMDIDTTDAGQIALLAAEKSTANFAFKIEMNDKPVTGASPKPSQRLFYGLVMSAAEELGDADSMAKLNCQIALNSNIVRVTASAS